MRQLSSTEREQVLTFIQQSQKILAIKYIRHLFNYGVSEAKHDVEQLMINPDFEPKIKEQQSDQPSDALYQNLEHNENTLELFLTRNNGEILLIDEQHPEWRAVMLHFNAREFSTKQDYINAMRLKRNAEDRLNTATTSRSTNPKCFDVLQKSASSTANSRPQKQLNHRYIYCDDSHDLHNVSDGWPLGKIVTVQSAFSSDCINTNFRGCNAILN